MTPFEQGFTTKLAGLMSFARRTAKYLPTAAALGLASGVGGELIPKIYNDAVDKDEDYSFWRNAAMGTAIGIPLAYMFRKSAPDVIKSLGMPNSGKYFKNLSLLKGADPLITMKKGRQLWKPAAGAVAGAAINYDKDNKFNSLAKGALVGGTLASPLMFKDNDAHQGFAHKFMNEVLDSPAIAVLPAAAGVAYPKARDTGKAVFSKAKSLFQGQPKANQQQPSKLTPKTPWSK